MYVFAQRLQLEHHHLTLINFSPPLIHPAVTRNHDFDDYSMMCGRSISVQERSYEEKDQCACFTWCNCHQLTQYSGQRDH